MRLENTLNMNSRIALRSLLWACTTSCLVALLTSNPTFAQVDEPNSATEGVELKELSEGVQLLDEALAAKMNARRVSDLAKVIKLCEDSIAAGLEEADQAFAKQLLSSCYYETAKRIVQMIEGRRVNRASYSRSRAAAVKALQSALEANPDDGESHLLMGQLQDMPGGDVDAGRKSLKRAVELLEDSPIRRSVAWANLASLTDDVDEKIEYLNNAIQSDGDNLDALRERGRAHLQAKNFDAAESDFVDAVRKDSSDTNSLDIATRLMLADDKRDDAMDLMSEILEKDPDAHGIYTLRANLRIMESQYDEAAEDLDSALELKPNDVAALMARAQLSFMQEDDDEALADVNRVLELSPGLRDAHMLRSNISQFKGNFRQAISDLRQLLKSDPDNKEWLTRIANVYMADNRPTMAIDTYDQILKKNPTDSSALKGRANALLTIGKHEQAIQTYEKVVRQIPDDSESLNNLAWVLATSTEDDLRDGNRAIELAKKACELTEFKAAHILSTLAAGYAEVGNFEEAKDWSSKAVKLGEGEIKSQLEEELEMYKSNKPWRERQQVESDEDDLGLSSDLDL